MKILLFGKNGQVGWELQRSLAPLASPGQLIALGTDSQVMCGNLADQAGIRKTILDVGPDIIVNAAAYTAVDKAEQESQLAQAVNAEAPGVLAEEARRLNAWLIHYSTDYVFDGSGDQFHTENDTPNPLNVYGKTKLAGESNIIETDCRHVILRTSWVYATYGSNFIKTILRLAQERDQLRIVSDQIGAPTGAELIADVTAHIVQSLRNRENEKSISGLYHLAAQGHISWYGFAHYILSQAASANVSLKTTTGNLYPIPSTEYPTPAVRPLNSRLDTTKLQKTFNLYLPDWHDGVFRTLSEILMNQQSHIS